MPYIYRVFSLFGLITIYKDTDGKRYLKIRNRKIRPLF
jgi:hypothetical protein